MKNKQTFLENILEIFSTIFFKAITIAGTTSSVYLLLNYLSPSEELVAYYIYTGIALGLIIAFYITPYFSKIGDTQGLVFAILAVSFLSYMPSSAVIYNWLQAKAVATIDIAKPNYVAFKQAEKEFYRLKKERAVYINEPLLKKKQAQSEKQIALDYQRDLKNFKKRQAKHKETCNITWSLPTYRTKNAQCQKDFNEKEPTLSRNIITNYTLFDTEYEKRKTSSFNIAQITLQKEIMQKEDPTAYENKVAAKKASLPSFYLVMFLVLVLGIIIESLGELPYWLSLRAKSIEKEEDQEAEPKAEETLHLLPYVVNNTQNVKVAPALTEINLLKERFKNVNVGDKLVSKSKLPFKDKRLAREMSKLNRKLKEGGFITKSTHPEALKSLEEALAYVKAS